MNTGSPKEKGKALGAQAAALLVGLVVVAAFVYASFSTLQVTSTSSSSGPSASTTARSMSASSVNSITQASTNASSILARCSRGESYGPNDSLITIGNVVAGTVSPVVLCLQLYYFSASTETLNLTAGPTSSGISIWSVTGPYFSGVPTVTNVDSNFTTSSSQDQLVMGGPANLGEGTVVAYSILAKPGVNGTFQLGLGFELGAQPMLMESQTAEGCVWYGQVFAGNVSPTNSFLPSGCQNIAEWPGYCTGNSNSTDSQCSTIPGVPYQLIDGHIFFRIISGTRSTSTSTTPNLAACSSPSNTLLNPDPKGTVYMKVVSDRGTVITNGTLFVTQFGTMNGGGREAGYCINLRDVNGTGYMQLAANVTLITSGYYNVTLMVGYNPGPWFWATIPSIQVHPNSTVYVAVSVPTGVVTIVTESMGSSFATTTTTSATSTKINAP